MSKGQDASSAIKQPSAALVRAVTRMLGPLVRLLIARGITFSYLSGLLKTVYVAEAEKSLVAAGEVPTVSRLSIVTGLQRKDINRIQSEPPPEESPPAAVSLGARLIGIWTGDRKFRTAKGLPAPLPRSAKGSGASFDALVRSVSTDVSPRVILDEGHSIRNGSATSRWRHCMYLAANSLCRWILSATPIQNGINDWNNLCRWLRVSGTPAEYPSYNETIMLRRTMADLRADIKALR